MIFIESERLCVSGSSSNIFTKSNFELFLILNNSSGVIKPDPELNTSKKLTDTFSSISKNIKGWIESFFSPPD